MSAIKAGQNQGGMPDLVLAQLNDQKRNTLV